jgi:AcrR family transcriptional regulator
MDDALPLTPSPLIKTGKSGKVARRDTSARRLSAAAKLTSSKVGDMRLTTQQRVLDKSAELFNRYGIEAVSVNQIAEALTISPGNLTYHYKKKSDLLETHISVFEKQLQNAVETLPIFSDAKTFSSGYMEFMALIWRYRFLFIGVNYIIQNDLVEISRYNKLIESTKRTIIRQVKRLVADGYMQPVKKPYSIKMLVDSIWWQWLGLLLAIQVTPLDKRPPERKLLADAVLHILFISHHYIDPHFFAAVQAELAVLERQPLTVTGSKPVPKG